MNYRIVISAFLLCCGTSWAAQNAWISDQLRTSVIAEPKSGAKFLGTIRSGEAVSEIERSANGEYVRIKAPEIAGWVLARNIINTPSVHQLQAQSEAQIERLQTDNAALSAERRQHLESIEALKKQTNAALEAAEQAKAELIALQRASSNVVAIDNRNRELQAALVSLEQENLSLKHKNLRLSEDVTQRQMYTGGFLVLAGFILNWLGGFFRFAGRRRRSFDDL